jgi:hypothetical protein
MSEQIPQWQIDYMRWKYGLPPEGGQPNQTSGNPSKGAKNPNANKTVVKHKGPRIEVNSRGTKTNYNPEELRRLREMMMAKEVPTSRSMIGNALSKAKGYVGNAAKVAGRYANPLMGAALAYDSYNLYKMAKEERDFEQFLNAQMNADRAEMGVELDAEAQMRGMRPLFASEFFMQNGAPSRQIPQSLERDIDLARQLRNYLDDEQISRAEDSAAFYRDLSRYNAEEYENLRMQESENNFRNEQERSRREGTGPTPAYQPRTEPRTQTPQSDGFFSEIEAKMAEIFGR